MHVKIIASQSWDIFKQCMRCGLYYTYLLVSHKLKKCENLSASGDVMAKSKVAHFFDLLCSIQALVKVRQS